MIHAILPKPSKIRLKSGRLNLGGRVVFIADDRVAGLQRQMDLLHAALQGGRGRKGRIIWVEIELGKAHADLGAEGYRLSLGSHGVFLKAQSLGGLRHAVTTLRQLCDTAGGGFIRAMEIEDKPAFAWRGVLIDSCRHFLSVPFLKKTIDELAYIKMNRLHWHLTEDQAWRLEIKKYPRLAKGFAPGGHYTQKQVRELVAYAAERGITIVPEIEVPGHATAVLAALPSLSCLGRPFPLPGLWGTNRHVFCAGKEETFRFINDVLREVVGLFPSAEIHIGCDEVRKDKWKECPLCQKRMLERGLKDEKALQSYFAGRCVAMLKKLGRRAVAWDEINEGGAPKGVIVQCWHAHKPDLVAQAAKDGLQALASSTEFCYFDYSNWSLDFRKASQFNPIPKGLNARQRKLVLGGECTMWSEYFTQAGFNQKFFPRGLATAEVLWSGKADYADLRKRAEVQVGRLKARGVKSGTFEATRREKAIPWEPKFWDKKFPKALKMPMPPGW